MAEFIVRDARLADRECIGMLWRELMRYHHSLDPRFVTAPDATARYVRHIQELMRGRNSRVLVACDSATGGVVGYIVGELQERPPMTRVGMYGFVSDIFVREEWRRHGAGQALFEELRRWFKDRKATAIELYAASANPNAVEFWTSMGLTPFLTLMHLDL
jgi:GNAT superfamily N-acetyltransferase